MQWCHSPDIHGLYLNQALGLHGCHSTQGYRSIWEHLLSDCQTCYVPLIAASQTLGVMQHCMRLKQRLLARGYSGWKLVAEGLSQDLEHGTVDLNFSPISHVSLPPAYGLISPLFSHSDSYKVHLILSHIHGSTDMKACLSVVKQVWTWEKSQARKYNVKNGPIQATF